MVKLRPATSADLPFLREMLYETAYWRFPEDRPAIDTALSYPDLAKLLEGWGRSGDTAIIAVGPGNRPLGAAWYRFWTASNHSYGFVDPQTPEIGLAVKATARRQGIGTSLMLALVDQAREARIQQISLSVEPDNDARRLYERLGFRFVEQVGGAHTMLLVLQHSGRDFQEFQE